MNLSRLAKVWALTTSSAPGEAAAARARARRIVQHAGKTLADVPALLGQVAPAPKPAAFAFVDVGTPEGRAAWAAQEAHRKARRSHAEAPERAEVLCRYGTEDAALAWTTREQQLRAAVRQWSTFHRPARRWTQAMDGWTLASLDDPPQRVLDAIGGAYPLPDCAPATWPTCWRGSDTLWTWRRAPRRSSAPCCSTWST